MRRSILTVVVVGGQTAGGRRSKAGRAAVVGNAVRVGDGGSASVRNALFGRVRRRAPSLGRVAVGGGCE